LLHFAARKEHLESVVRPALAAGEWVISDRFADSTLAYQGYGAGVDLEPLRQLAEIATGGLAPDLTILLDVAPEIGLARKSAEDRTRFETAFDLEFHRRVRAGFLALAAAEPHRFRIVDADRKPDLVFADVLAAALEGL
jgi:dTMP kinase